MLGSQERRAVSDPGMAHGAQGQVSLLSMSPNHHPALPQHLMQNLSPWVPCLLPPCPKQAWGSNLCCYTPYNHPQEGTVPNRVLKDQPLSLPSPAPGWRCPGLWLHTDSETVTSLPRARRRLSITGLESSDHILHPSSTSCHGLETPGKSLLPSRPQCSYLQNGGLGWVITKGSEDLPSTFSGP